jgi:hypothetical protein
MVYDVRVPTPSYILSKMKVYFQIVTINKNMAAMRTCEVGTALAPVLAY